MVTTRQNPTTQNTDVMLPGSEENPQWVSLTALLPQEQGVNVALLPTQLDLISGMEQDIDAIKAQADAMALNLASIDFTVSNGESGTNTRIAHLTTATWQFAAAMAATQATIASNALVYQADISSIDAAIANIDTATAAIQTKQAQWDTNDGPAGAATLRVAIASGNETPPSYSSRTVTVGTVSAATVTSANTSRTFLLIENATDSVVYIGMGTTTPSASLYSISLQPSQQVALTDNEAAIMTRAIGTSDGAIMVTEGIRG